MVTVAYSPSFFLLLLAPFFLYPISDYVQLKD